MRSGLICLGIGWIFSFGGFAAEPVVPSRGVEPLIQKHDANGNGKIDAREHKAYARERAEKHIAEVKELAKHRPKLNRQERLFYQLPRVTPEVIQYTGVNP